MFTKAIGLAAALLLIAEPALAQIPISPPPSTFSNGLAAGLGRPFIGLGHLAAVIAVGCLAAAQPRGELLTLGYVLASIIGATAHIGEATLPNVDVYVALSVVMLGLMVFRKTPLKGHIVLALFVAGGLVNGYAMGATIAAAQRTPILGYLLGLLAIQCAIALAVVFGVKLLAPRTAVHLLTTRVIGAFAVGAGAAILLQRYAGGA
jgi:urease accessory protein